MTWLCNY